MARFNRDDPRLALTFDDAAVKAQLYDDAIAAGYCRGQVANLQRYFTALAQRELVVTRPPSKEQQQAIAHALKVAQSMLSLPELRQLHNLMESQSAVWFDLAEPLERLNQSLVSFEKIAALIGDRCPFQLQWDNQTYCFYYAQLLPQGFGIQGWCDVAQPNLPASIAHNVRFQVADALPTAIAAQGGKSQAWRGNLDEGRVIFEVGQRNVDGTTGEDWSWDYRSHPLDVQTHYRSRQRNRYLEVERSVYFLDQIWPILTLPNTAIVGSDDIIEWLQQRVLPQQVAQYRCS